MISQLEQLKEMTTVVADSGDILLVEKYLPVDATTNPSLILQAAKDPKYQHILDFAVSYAKNKTNNEKQMLEIALEKVLVNFGVLILGKIPGRVSVEVDARYSYDKENSYKRAKRLIALFEEMHIPKSRILIKLASTWEGISAAQRLQEENIQCNMTLLFSLFQAIACAEANVRLISPFVGRILDWYQKKYPHKTFSPKEDPGVIFVTQIYNYFKKFNHPTQIMGASFRSTEQVLHLAGCDLLTISPNLLQQLKENTTPIERHLSEDIAKKITLTKITVDENSFKENLANNPMAAEKLKEGIERFSCDTEKLEAILLEKLSLKAEKVLS